MAKKLKLDIVSAEESIYHGHADAVYATGLEGELGIHPGHMQLLTVIKPGQVRFTNEGKEDVFYVSGGVFEVQPYEVTILADTAIRADELDENAVLEAKKRAEDVLSNKTNDFEYAKASAELAQAVAQIRAIQKLRQKHRT